MPCDRPIFRCSIWFAHLSLSLSLSPRAVVSMSIEWLSSAHPPCHATIKAERATHALENRPLPPRLPATRRARVPRSSSDLPPTARRPCFGNSRTPCSPLCWAREAKSNVFRVSFRLMAPGARAQIITVCALPCDRHPRLKTRSLSPVTQTETRVCIISVTRFDGTHTTTNKRSRQARTAGCV